MKKISTFLWVLMALLALPQATGAQTFDTEVDNIAAFIAAEDGKTVKLTLTDARVNAFNDLSGTYYVEDATGAVAVKGIALTKGTKLNGYVIGVKNTEDVDYVNTPSQGLEYQLTVDGSASEFTATATELAGTEMTIIEACQQANYGKLITVSNVDVTALGNGRNKQLADANGNTIKARDLFGVLPSDYTWPAKATKVTGVALYYMTGWFIIPISEEAIVEYVQPTEVLLDFKNNNQNLPYSEGGASDPAEKQNAGNLGGKTIKVDEVKFTFVNAPTMCTKYHYDANGTNSIKARGTYFQMIKGGQMRITAPEGYAITKVEFAYNPSENTNTGAIAYQTNLTLEKGGGTLANDKSNWMGNAKSIRFGASGAVYLNSIIVTLATANSETAEATYDTYAQEVSTLKDFNALADGTLVKLNLNNVVVTAGMNNELGNYVQDETAGAHFYCTGLTFNVNDVLNGYVYVKKSNQPLPGPRIAQTEETNAENISVTSGSYEPIEGTKVADLKKADNVLKVVKLTGVAVKGSAETTAKITDSDNGTLEISNGKTNYAPYVYRDNLTAIDYSKATVVGILYGPSSSQKLYPLSITDETATAITDIKTTEDAENVVIYNLQGVRLNKFQKGINIVNGKKVVIK